MPSMKRVKMKPGDLPKTPKMLKGTAGGAPKPMKSVKTGGKAKAAPPTAKGTEGTSSGSKPMGGQGMKSEYRKKGKRHK